MMRSFRSSTVAMVIAAGFSGVACVSDAQVNQLVGSVDGLINAATDRVEAGDSSQPAPAVETQDGAAPAAQTPVEDAPTNVQTPSNPVTPTEPAPDAPTPTPPQPPPPPAAPVEPESPTPPPPQPPLLPPGALLAANLNSPCPGGATPECRLALEDNLRGALFQMETPDPSGLTKVTRLAICPAGGFVYIEALRDGFSNSTTTLVPQEIVQPGEQLLFEVASFVDSSGWQIESIDATNVAISIYIVDGMVPVRPQLNRKSFYFALQVDGAGGTYLNGVPAQIFAAGGDICFAR